MYRFAVIATGTLAFLASGVGQLTAQACIGSPMAVRGYAVAPAIRVERRSLVLLHDDGTRTYSVPSYRAYALDVAARPAGRLSFGAGYAYTRLDHGLNRHEASGSGALELARGKASLCATAGVDVSRVWTLALMPWTDETGRQRPASAGDFTRTDRVFPIGMAVGSSIEVAAETPLSLYFHPQMLFIRHSSHYQLLDYPLDADFVDWNQGVGLELGARLRRGPVFGGLSYLHSTWAERHDALTLSLGYTGVW